MNVDQTKATGSDGNILEPVEKVAILGRSSFQRYARKCHAPWTLVGDFGAALEILNIGHFDRKIAAFLETTLTDVVKFIDELEFLLKTFLDFR